MNRYRSLMMPAVVMVALFVLVYKGIVWCDANKIRDPYAYDVQYWVYFLAGVTMFLLLLLGESLLYEPKDKR